MVNGQQFAVQLDSLRAAGHGHVRRTKAAELRRSLLWRGAVQQRGSFARKGGSDQEGPRRQLSEQGSRFLTEVSLGR